MRILNEPLSRSEAVQISDEDDFINVAIWVDLLDLIQCDLSGFFTLIGDRIAKDFKVTNSHCMVVGCMPNNHMNITGKILLNVRTEIL